jgi:hypothetical protein
MSRGSCYTHIEKWCLISFVFGDMGWKRECVETPDVAIGGSVHDSPAPKADAWCLKIPGIGISVRVQIPPSAPPTGSRRADSSPAGGLIARHELATVGMSGNALSVADSSGVYKLANDGQDTRALQRYLGHKNIQHTVRYTELSPDRFKSFWEDLVTEVAAAMRQFGRYVVKTRT